MNARVKKRVAESLSRRETQHASVSRYMCGKIGAHEIQIRDEVGAHVLCFWTLVTEVKCLGCLHIENTKKKQQVHNY